MKKFYGILIMLLVFQLSFAQKISDPQLNSPENEFVNAMPNIILDWAPVTGIGQITYHIQLATDAGFTNLVVDEDGIEQTAYFNENLMFAQQYFWRVKANDDDGASNWSAAYSFTVFSTVYLNEPDDGDDEVDLRPTLEWEDEVDDVVIEGVGGFYIEVDTIESFDSPYQQTYIASGSEITYITDYLLFGKMHYWRVRPFNTNGVGEWSEVWGFETIPVVEPKKPNNNANGEEFDMELTWKALEENNDDIFEYTIEVSTDEVFTSPITLITNEDAVSPGFLKFDTEYWWRVRARHANDTSPWSEVRKFSTVVDVSLTSPADGAVLETTRPKLTWSTLPEVGGYQIRFGKSADHSDADYYLIPNGSTNNYPLPDLDKDSDYYWSVRAFRTTDTSAWAEDYSFNIPWNVGVNEIETLSNINLYPNPSSHNLNVSLNVKETAEMTWVITDILGQNITEDIIMVKTGFFSKNIDVSEFRPGIYFIEIRHADQKSVMKFVVK